MLTRALVVQANLFDRLAVYKKTRGDCSVPQGWAEDPRLGTWVKNQRYFKKKLDRGELSEGMTAARVVKLDTLGFAWEAPAGGNRDDAGWERRLAKLKEYKRAHGDCSVPKGWAEDPRLATWVKAQRQHKKKLDRGEPCEGMTAARAAKLEALGFAWGPRQPPVPTRGRRSAAAH
jgi:hypothetical protein